MDINPKIPSKNKTTKQDSVKKPSEDEQESKSSDSDDSSAYRNFRVPLRSSGTYLKKTGNRNSPPPSFSVFSDQQIDNGLYWTVGEQEYIGECEKREEIRPCKSETEESSSTESKEKSEEGSVSSEALSNVYAKLSPFTILWTFGTNPKVGIINLTTSQDFEVFYASGHYGVIFNYVMNTMTMYPGHICPITTIDADSSGRWLITADAGEDTVIIIWDKKRKLPVWSLYNVFPGEGVLTAKISQDARFLAATNCNFNYTVKFWRWTYGREEPDGAIDLDPAYGKPKHIDFNHRNTQQFVITIESNVTFCEWNEKEKIIQSYTPNYEICKKKLGTLRESLFLDDRHTTLTSTSHGYVLVWCDIQYSKPIRQETPGTIRRDFLKELKLHETGIISLRLSDKVIASSSEDGTILFHDQTLRLMYRISNLNASYFSFNIDYLPCHYDPFSQKYNDAESISSSNEKTESAVEVEIPEKYGFDDGSVQSEIFPKDNVAINCDIPYPSDYTLQKQAFPMRDLIFMTQTGKMGYLSHARKKAKYYLYDTETPALSMDCNPNSPHLTVGYSNGRLMLYDYNSKKILISTKFSNAITSLKYSHLGHYLIAGFQNGDLMELHPILLTPKTKLDTLKAPISKISFSKNDDLLAFFDQNSTVQLFKKKKGIKHAWTSMGKYISHYKPIVDIMFVGESDKNHEHRLFTIGQDRMLVEYDLENLEEDKLKILSITRIEQTAIPCCFTEYTGFSKVLISNDQYKIKVFDLNQQICEKTTLGPTADTPIKFMKIIKQEREFADRAKMVYTTDKHIGLRLLPPSGNPFEGMGIIGHPEKLCALALSFDHKYIFTVGINDCTPFMWEVNHGSLEVASHLGGEGLEPFISLIEGGPNGFLFKEIEDFFYYAQIIHQGEDPNLDRSVSKFLDLCEVPDLFRALGYYPTDYEITNLLYELKHINYDKTGELCTEITFDECVKAYLNHRSVMGISYQDIKNALMSIADVTDPTDILVERNDIYKILEERGEPMEHAEAVGYLCILLLPKDENNPLPPCMNIDDFVEQAFGIDPSITEENVREITHAFENKN